MTEQTKDYSLLRPFDLEAAKAGEPTCWDDEEAAKFVAESADGMHCFSDEQGVLFMADSERIYMKPLAWVEGRPVYKGDELYYKSSAPMAGAKRTIKGVNGFGSFFFMENDMYGCQDAFTWEAPKPAPKTKKVKMYCYLMRGELIWKDAFCSDWKRAPSEDREIEVEA